MSKSKNIVIIVLSASVMLLLVVVAFLLGIEHSNKQSKMAPVVGSNRPVVDHQMQPNKQEAVKVEQPQLMDPGFGECRTCGFRDAVEKGTLKMSKMR